MSNSKTTTLHIDADSDIGHDETSLFVVKLSKPTPLPKMQLFIVFFVQAAESITATVIYPFVAQFVRDTGITKGDEKATGYYAGIIESAFYLAESATIFLWGRASNRFGRRPVLLLGPLGLCFAMLGFGLSSTFWPLVFYRLAQGVFNGNIGVAKLVMAELTDSSNMVGVFALLPLMYSVSATTGVTIGGLFSNPGTQWPDSFGKILILRQHPYFLPCLIAGSMAFVIFLFAFVGLKETHPLYRAPSRPSAQTLIKSKLHQSPIKSYGTLDHSTDDEPMETPSIRSLMIRQVLIPLGSMAFFPFTETSYIVLIPLMFSTSIENGGLGLSAYQIGSTMGAWGFYNILWQASAVPRLIKIFGPKKIHVFGYSCHLIGFSLLIITNLLARAFGKVNNIIWSLIVIQFLFCNSMIYMVTATAHMFLVNSAPSPAALPVINSFGQVVRTLARTIAPVMATSLFSFSTENQLMNGYFVFFIYMCVTMGGIRICLLLPHELRRTH